ncbi:YopX family protein [Bacillus sp. SDLI1]|uniref:YopX family protein n=1 Tax=Bacillus sp. SDLI1 TaxID=1774743 RepID=UPI0009EBA27F|nr:YopX family protein [Bacillus sp. SDLI1]
MREIKFRAWDDVKDRMLYLGEEDDIVFEFGGSGIVATDITEDEPNFKTLHHLIYLQYTGLKDKNGREIYEGDIVRITSEDDEEEFNICEVKYSGGAFQVDVSGLSSDYDVTAVGWVEYTTIEVIGNIYEDPGLIESK